MPLTIADTAPLEAAYIEFPICAVTGPSIEDKKTIDDPFRTFLPFNNF